MHVASSAEPNQDSVDLESEEQVRFSRKSSTLTTSNPVVKGAMLNLRKAWPASVPYPQLAASAQPAVAGRPIPVDSFAMSRTSEELAATLLRCYGTSVVDLHADQCTFSLCIGDCPRVTAVARDQAARNPTVTNRKHERVTLNDIQRFVLLRLDGRTTRDELLDQAASAVEMGELILYHANGHRISGCEQARVILGDLLPTVLTDLAQKALLVPQQL